MAEGGRRPRIALASCGSRTCHVPIFVQLADFGTKNPTTLRRAASAPYLRSRLPAPCCHDRPTIWRNGRNRTRCCEPACFPPAGGTVEDVAKLTQSSWSRAQGSALGRADRCAADAGPGNPRSAQAGFPGEIVVLAPHTRKAPPSWKRMHAPPQWPRQPRGAFAQASLMPARLPGDAKGTPGQGHRDSRDKTLQSRADPLPRGQSIDWLPCRRGPVGPGLGQ